MSKRGAVAAASQLLKNPKNERDLEKNIVLASSRYLSFSSPPEGEKMEDKENQMKPDLVKNYIIKCYLINRYKHTKSVRFSIPGNVSSEKCKVLVSPAVYDQLMKDRDSGYFKLKKMKIDDLKAKFDRDSAFDLMSKAVVGYGIVEVALKSVAVANYGRVLGIDALKENLSHKIRGTVEKDRYLYLCRLQQELEIILYAAKLIRSKSAKVIPTVHSKKTEKIGWFEWLKLKIWGSGEMLAEDGIDEDGGSDD